MVPNPDGNQDGLNRFEVGTMTSIGQTDNYGASFRRLQLTLFSLDFQGLLMVWERDCCSERVFFQYFWLCHSGVCQPLSGVLLEFSRIIPYIFSTGVDYSEKSSTFASRSDRNNDNETQTSPARGLKREKKSRIYWDNVLEDMKE